MTDKKLKTAVLGLDEKARPFLAEARDSDFFDLIAVADKNSQTAQKLAKQYDCLGYDDYRLLVVENKFDCLIVTAPIHTCDEYLKTAIKNKTAILKICPPARNFDETSTFLNLAKKKDSFFLTVSPNRFSDCFTEIKSNLEDIENNPVTLITGQLNSCENQNADWLTDPKLAGGGALLNSAYHLVDLITAFCGLPQQVYSLTTNRAEDKQQRLYRTEEIALISMKFAENRFAHLTVTSDFGTVGESLKIITQQKIITASPESLTVSDHLGKNYKQKDFTDNGSDVARKILQDFALKILDPENHTVAENTRQTLNNMAVIEATYLSAKTAMPEEPLRIAKLTNTELPQS